MPRLARWLATLAVLALPATAPAATPNKAQYTGELQGTKAFVAIVKKGQRFRAYVSDGTPRRVTLSAWFWGGIGADGHLSGEWYGLKLEADLEGQGATGTVTLPDGRAFGFTGQSGFGGGLIDRSFSHAGTAYRSGWVVLRDNRVRGRTTVAGTAFDGLSASGPGIRPSPSCEQLDADYEALREQRGRLLAQSGVWELRLNRGRGSSAPYNRLNQAIGALDELVFEVERRLQAACDSPSAGSFSSAEPDSARNSTSTSLNA
jgi:hypothetical protein